MTKSTENYPDLKHTGYCCFDGCRMRVDDGVIFCEPRCKRLYGEERARAAPARGASPSLAAELDALVGMTNELASTVQLVRAAQADGVKFTSTKHGVRFTAMTSTRRHWEPQLREHKARIAEALFVLRGDKLETVDL